MDEQPIRSKKLTFDELLALKLQEEEEQGEKSSPGKPPKGLFEEQENEENEENDGNEENEIDPEVEVEVMVEEGDESTQGEESYFEEDEGRDQEGDQEEDEEEGDLDEIGEEGDGADEIEEEGNVVEDPKDSSPMVRVKKGRNPQRKQLSDLDEDAPSTDGEGVLGCEDHKQSLQMYRKTARSSTDRPLVFFKTRVQQDTPTSDEDAEFTTREKTPTFLPAVAPDRVERTEEHGVVSFKHEDSEKDKKGEDVGEDTSHSHSAIVDELMAESDSDGDDVDVGAYGKDDAFDSYMDEDDAQNGEEFDVSREEEIRKIDGLDDEDEDEDEDEDDGEDDEGDEEEEKDERSHNGATEEFAPKRDMGSYVLLHGRTYGAASKGKGTEELVNEVMNATDDEGDVEHENIMTPSTNPEEEQSGLVRKYFTREKKEHPKSKPSSKKPRIMKKQGDEDTVDDDDQDYSISKEKDVASLEWKHKLEELEKEIERYRQENDKLKDARREMEISIERVKRKEESLETMHKSEEKKVEKGVLDAERRLKIERKAFEKERSVFQKDLLVVKQLRTENETLKKEKDDLTSRAKDKIRRMRLDIQRLEQRNGDLLKLNDEMKEQLRRAATKEEDLRDSFEQKIKTLQEKIRRYQQQPVSDEEKRRIIEEQESAKFLRKKTISEVEDRTAQTKWVGGKVVVAAQQHSSKSKRGGHVEIIDVVGVQDNDDDADVDGDDVTEDRGDVREVTKPVKGRKDARTRYGTEQRGKEDMPYDVGEEDEEEDGEDETHSSYTEAQDGSFAFHDRREILADMLVFPDPSTLGPVVNERSSESKQMVVYANGHRTILFKNGTRKDDYAGKKEIYHFANGDIKKKLKDGTTVYYYSSTKATNISFPSKIEEFIFETGQTERHFPNGAKEIRFPDGSMRRILPE